MNPHINNLGGTIAIDPANPTLPVSIDAGTPLTITGDGTKLTSLDVGFFWGSRETDHLDIDQTGSVKIVGTDVLVSGTLIGVLSEKTRDTVYITFNDEVTYTLAAELLRAFIYRSSATSTGFTEQRAITVLLSNENDDTFQSEIYIADDIVGTAGNDIFHVNLDIFNKGEALDGGDGDDTLVLNGGGFFNLFSFSKFNSIEIIKGSAADDNIFLSAEQLAGLKSIDGGANGTPGDTLQLSGALIDLRGKDIKNFEKIVLLGLGNSAILTDKIFLPLLRSTGGSGQKVTFEGVLTDAERLQLHHHGIDIVTAKNAAGVLITTTHDKPKVTQLNDLVNTSVGRAVFVDKGQNTLITSDDGLFSHLSIRVSGTDYDREQLGFDTSGKVKLENGTKIVVNNIEIGRLDGGGYSLSIFFNDHATPALVQELVRALTYTHKSGTPPADPKSIVMRLSDAGGRQTEIISLVRFSAEDPLDPGPAPLIPDPIILPPVNAAPTQISLNSATVAEMAINGTVIGTLSAQDPDAGDSFTYRLLSNAGGRFALDASGTRIVVADGTKLDYEQAALHTITVRVTDKAGLFLDQTLRISVQDVLVENVTGSASDDILVAGAGKDSLKGSLGRDRLTGGIGADKLWGGSGADVFVYTSVKDSTVSVMGRDVIYDFSPRDTDRIDLTAMDANSRKSGDQAFKFIGKESFHRKAGELRYEKASGGIMVSGDINGDGKADFAVTVKGLASFSKGYFML
jgi:VCBS repeat-containing protein